VNGASGVASAAWHSGIKYGVAACIGIGISISVGKMAAKNQTAASANHGISIKHRVKMKKSREIIRHQKGKMARIRKRRTSWRWKIASAIRRASGGGGIGGVSDGIISGG